MLQTDSITASHHQEAGVQITEEHTGEQPRHAYQVLQELPPDATPAQQDSALQTLYGRQPYAVHAVELDSTSLLNRSNIKSIEKEDLPQYYRQNFFSADSLFHPELNGGRYGVAGDPVPYTLHGDNMITALLLGCFILAFIAFSKSRRFILRQAKEFFRTPRSGTTEITETTNEFRFQFFLIAQTCLLLSLVTFFYAQEYNGDTFLVSSQYQLIAIFFGVFAGYFIIKLLLYAVVDWVFFSKRENERWIKSFLFMASVEGLAMFPMVISQAYFGLSVRTTVIYTISVAVLARLLSLYKCFSIFFRQRGFFLQIFLYFCALEIIPLLSLCGGLSVLISYLNINF